MKLLEMHVSLGIRGLCLCHEWVAGDPKQNLGGTKPWSPLIVSWGFVVGNVAAGCLATNANESPKPTKPQSKANKPKAGGGLRAVVWRPSRSAIAILLAATGGGKRPIGLLLAVPGDASWKSEIGREAQGGWKWPSALGHWLSQARRFSWGVARCTREWETRLAGSMGFKYP